MPEKQADFQNILFQAITGHVISPCSLKDIPSSSLLRPDDILHLLAIEIGGGLVLYRSFHLSSGIDYRYSRNLGHLGQIIVFVGIGIASSSWLYLLLSAILIVLTYLLIAIEERVTLDKLGETYRKYMNRTPRWLGIPKK